MTTLYQHGTLAQLMAKEMAGTITIQELKKHGDTGIGTLDGLDGEVIFLAGETYQADSTGTVNYITDELTTLPFATVHFDELATSSELNLNKVAFENLSDILSNQQITNVFSALKVHGQFSRVHVRIAPKQSRPYPSLLEVAQMQPEFERENVAGTLLGYYSPAVFGGVSAPGWHLHFLSDDHTFAGHVLDFSAVSIIGTLQIFDDFIQHLPVENSAFRSINQDMSGLHEGIEASEGGKR